MRITCGVTIDNPEEREQFIKQLKTLGCNPETNNNNVFIEYVGYNVAHYDAIIRLFEEKHRNTIKIRND